MRMFLYCDILNEYAS